MHLAKGIDTLLQYFNISRIIEIGNQDATEHNHQSIGGLGARTSFISVSPSGIELLRALLGNEKITCDIINGKVPVNKRTEIVNRFQTDSNPRVLLIQPKAASHGLTLTAADTIIWYAPTTSVETYLQANARIDRAGQKNAMTIVHITGSEVEARLYRMLQNNIDNHEKLIDIYRIISSSE